MAGSGTYRSRFGDTTLTKVFVGGLAWQTPNEELRRYYEQFGEILEAVIITDKATGRSKGYGFVTFRDPDSARRACVEPNPIIDGRRANCNIASQGLSRASSRGRAGSAHQSARPYGRPPPQMPPPPPAGLYHPPYGYVTYTADYGYSQPAIYNPQVAPQFYGTSSTSRVGMPYPYAPVGYSMQTSPRLGFPFMHRMQGTPPPPPPPPPLLPYAQYSAVGHGGEASFSASPTGLQAQAPPAGHDTLAPEPQASLQQQPTSTGANDES